MVKYLSCISTGCYVKAPLSLSSPRFTLEKSKDDLKLGPVIEKDIFGAEVALESRYRLYRLHAN